MMSSSIQQLSGVGGTPTTACGQPVKVMYRLSSLSSHLIKHLNTLDLRHESQVSPQLSYTNSYV